MTGDGFRFRWERALRDSDIGKAAKAVGFVMGTYANMDGTKVHPGIDLLAAGSGYGERMARGAVKDLEAAGFVALVRPGNGLQRKAAEYRLTNPAESQTGNTRHPYRQSATTEHVVECRPPDHYQIKTTETGEAAEEIPEEIRALMARAPSFYDEGEQTQHSAAAGEATEPQDIASVEAALTKARPTTPTDPLRPSRTPHPKEETYSRRSHAREARDQGFDPETGEYLDRPTERSGYLTRR